MCWRRWPRVPAGWPSALPAYRLCAVAALLVQHNRRSILSKVVVIINAAAGAGYAPDWARQLEEQFAAVGLDAAITLASSGAEMMATATQALADGVEIVVAGGGDGSINAVASVLVEQGLGTRF